MTGRAVSAARPLIARGERAPDFALVRGGEDGPSRFYGLVGGRPAVLILTAGTDGAVVADVVAALRAARGHAVDTFVVTRTPRSNPDAFHDPEATVHRAYGVPEGDGAAVVLDANVRVLATTSLGDVDTTVREVIDAVPSPASEAASPAPRPAPVLFVPDALAPELCAELVERWHTDGAVESGVETVVDGARAEATDVRRKRRRDLVVTDQQLLRQLTQHVGARVLPELQKAFAFRARGFEGFKVGCYRAEDRGHFEAHRDNLSTGTAHRRFGLTLNLNDGYEGGELRFPEYGPQRYRPAAGEALVFSGSHLHEVLPVEQGERFVLLSFVLAAHGA